MNKKSIIAAVVALAMILLGTGYAYWTNTLNVTTKATTGEMDVTFADLGLYAQYDNELLGNPGWSIIDGITRDTNNGFVNDMFFSRGTADYNAIAAAGTIEQYYAQAAGYNNVTFDAQLVDPQAITASVGPYNGSNTNASDQIEISVNQMYPGYAQAFRSDIVNVGSIAAKLTKLNFEANAANEATNAMLGLAFYIDYEAYDGAGSAATDDAVFKLAAQFGSDDKFTVGSVEFVRFSALDGDAVALANTLLALPSDNRYDMYLGVAMDPDAEGVYTTGSTDVMAANDDTLTQNMNATLSINLLWDQFNAGVDVDTTNWLQYQNAGPR